MDLPTIAGISPLAELGRGGFGVVYEGRDERGALVAVKVGHRASHAARFRREVEALRQIGAPHVPALVGEGRLEDGRPYIVMERLEGETLEARIKALAEPMEVSAAVALSIDLLGCLAVVHDRGFVHRDLKPANIFLTPGGVRVMDFGLARFEDGVDLTRTGVIVGTVAYSSPEQLAGIDQIDGRADLYSVGVLLYELLSLERPFDGERAEVERGHMMLRPPALVASAADADSLDSLGSLIGELLAKDPSRRPPTAAAVIERLRGADRGEQALARPAARKNVGGGAEPVVLLSVAGDGLRSGEVHRIIERHRGFIARERGNRIIAVFAARGSAEPVLWSSSAAHELHRLGGLEVTLHLDDVLVRARPGASPAAYGSCLEDPGAWVASASGGPIKVTDELAAIAPDLRDEERATGEPPLYGRSALLDELERFVSSAASGETTLVTLLGRPGVGKTRIASEASKIAARAGARVIRLAGRDATAAALAAAAGGEAASADRTEAMRAASGALRALAAGDAVALIVDDAQLAELAFLDAIELAACATEGLRLLVLVCADIGLELARPEWGKRCDRFASLAIEVLDEAAALELAAHHLKPAEYPPAQALRRLAAWSGRNPHLLAELARSLKAGGAVAKRENAASYTVVTDVLDALPTSRAAQWLESQKLTAMSPDLAAFARLAAVTGPVVDIDELESILARLDRGGGAATRIDPSVGAGELAVAGWLVKVDASRFEWAREATRDAIYHLVRESDRRDLHRHALAYARELDDPERIARHAAHVGENVLAAESLLELVERSHEAREHLASEQYATRALDLLGDDEPHLRANILLGRGRARYRFHRAAEAADDLALAAEISASLADKTLEADARLELATALDWSAEFARSEAAVDQAGAVIEAIEGSSLATRLAIGRARSLWRRGDALAAVPLLRKARAATADRSDHQDIESNVVATILLATALVVLDELDEAAALFDQAEALCLETSDVLHGGVCAANRIWLWIAKNDDQRATTDLAKVISLARETGQPILESVASFNLAELLFWRGDDDEAAGYARRARLLDRRYLRPVPPDASLLLARIERSRDRDASEYIAEATALLAAVGAETERVLCAAVQGDPDWPALVARSAVLPPEAAIEVLYWAVRSGAASRERYLEIAAPLVEARPIWKTRFEAL